MSDGPRFLVWTSHHGHAQLSLWFDCDPRQLNSWRSYWEPRVLDVIELSLTEHGLSLTELANRHPAPVIESEHHGVALPSCKPRGSDEIASHCEACSA
jgi:hypothetical protein